MNFLPFENIEFDCALTKTEIENRVRNKIAWNTELGITFTKDPMKDYEGFVDQDTFKIRRVLKSGMNSFIPKASGTITKQTSSSKVELKIRLHKMVVIFMVFAMLFSATIGLLSISSEPETSESINQLLEDEALKEAFSENEYEKLVKKNLNPTPKSMN